MFLTHLAMDGLGRDYVASKPSSLANSALSRMERKEPYSRVTGYESG